MTSPAIRLRKGSMSHCRRRGTFRSLVGPGKTTSRTYVLRRPLLPLGGIPLDDRRSRNSSNRNTHKPLLSIFPPIATEPEDLRIFFLDGLHESVKGGKCRYVFDTLDEGIVSFIESDVTPSKPWLCRLACFRVNFSERFLRSVHKNPCQDRLPALWLRIKVYEDFSFIECEDFFELRAIKNGVRQFFFAAQGLHDFIVDRPLRHEVRIENVFRLADAVRAVFRLQPGLQ